jgi:hypothetical protein
MTLLNVAHYPGRHCASTGLSNLVKYHGIQWSEAMCFGLGEGLAVWFMYFHGLSPSRIVHVRTIDLESQFFKRIGHPFKWETFDTPEESEQGLRAKIDDGVPVILRTDLYHLPYYASNTHFPGHVITVWGYDSSREIFFVTDTERQELLEVPFENMRNARFCHVDFMTIEGHMFSPMSISRPDNLANRIRKAIFANSRTMVEGLETIRNVDGMAGGIDGLRRWQEEILGWQNFEDWQWTARFLYQNIEKRGTGGGGFRFLYADFLNEVAAYVPEITANGLPRKMEAIGRSWQKLAVSLKKASEAAQPDFTEAAGKLDLVVEQEEAYHRKVLMLFGRQT